MSRSIRTVKHVKAIFSGLTVIFACLAITSIGHAATYYVGKNGNNANSCDRAKNPLTPKLTIHAALSCVGADVPGGPGAGHAVIVKPGTYDEELYKVIPGGSSWGSPFTLKAETRGSVTLRPTSGACTDPITGQGGVPCDVIYTENASFVEIDGFMLDASNTAYYAVALNSDSVRVQYSELYNSNYSCILGGTHHNQFLHLILHACGKRSQSTYHLGQGGANDIYLTGNYNEVAYVHLYDSSAGIAFWADHLTPSYNVAHHNLIERGSQSGGIGMYKGPGNKAYNNVMVGIGIEVGWGCRGCEILNNTIYNAHAVGNGDYGIHIDATASGTVVKNNIIWQSLAGPIFDESATTTISNNLTVNPYFVNTSAKNFQLQASSPAIDAGANVSSEGVTDDIAGVARPQGNNYDIGAFEFTSSSDSTPPLPPKNVRVQ